MKFDIASVSAGGRRNLEQNKAQDDSPKFRGRAQAIAGLLQNLPAGTHLTAPEVLVMAQQAGIRISLSSVYRALALLKSEGAVMALSGEHGIRYEALDQDHDHDHLICMICGLTIEFSDELLKGFGRELARKNSYDYKRSKFDIYGICDACRSQRSDFKLDQLKSWLEKLQQQFGEATELMLLASAQVENRKVDKGAESLEKLQIALSDMRNDLSACLAALKSKEV